LKNVLNQNQDAGEADATPVQNKHKKGSFGLTWTVDFVAWPPQNTAKITLDRLKANLMDHCPRKSGLPAQN
jgi:hypothetical protein